MDIFNNNSKMIVFSTFGAHRILEVDCEFDTVDLI